MSIQEHVITALGAALEGERVGFFERSHVHGIFLAVAALAPEGCSLIRANGREEIGTRAGGSVRFFNTEHGGGRGVSLDRAYVPAALADEDVADLIAACLATSKRPQFIGYL